jgi:hypothetical protein
VKSTETQLQISNNPIVRYSPTELELLFPTTDLEWSAVEFAIDGQSASMSWCRAALYGP